MSTCPNGHPMTDLDRYCEECGEAATGPLTPPPPMYTLPNPEPSDLTTRFAVPAPATVAQPAPGVGPHPPVSPDTRWVIVATADEAFFKRMHRNSGPDGAAIDFPAAYTPRRFRLTRDRMVIGRRSARRGIEPDIDLSGTSADPGVSHEHAVVGVQPDGTRVITDLGSSNGTYLAGRDNPIKPHVDTPIRDGDYLHIGAWTRLTVLYEN